MLWQPVSLKNKIKNKYKETFCAQKKKIFSILYFLCIIVYNTNIE